MAMTGEMTGRQCWEVHKDTVTGIIEKHIKDPAMVNRLADAWNSAVDLGVTTAKASPAQKKKKTDRAIRLTSIRQATSVLLSQIGLIACKWCVYRGLHDCCLTTKKQFGQLGDSELCCGGVVAPGMVSAARGARCRQSGRGPWAWPVRSRGGTRVRRSPPRGGRQPYTQVSTHTLGVGHSGGWARGRGAYGARH